MQSFIFGPGAQVPSYDALKRRREIADMLSQQAVSSQPRTLGQGIASVGQALAGGLLHRNVAPKEDAHRKSRAEELAAIIAGNPSGGMGYSGNPTSMPVAMSSSGPAPQQGAPGSFSLPRSDMSAARQAVSSIESGGNYQAVGPTHPKLGRALGKYQVMEANIGPWSREVLGREVTPDEFLANSEIQDAIFDHRFGSYMQQHGPEGAAQAWFGGPGGVGRVSRRDALGTTIGDYGQRFLAAMGGGGDGGMPQPDMGQIAQLTDMLNDPYVSEGQRAVVQALLQQQLQGADPMRQLQIEQARLQNEALRNPQPDLTTAMQEYRFAVEHDGYRGSFEQWKQGQSPQTNVSVNNNLPDPGAWNPRHFEETYGTLQDEARNASEQLGMLDIAEQALNSGIRTGFGGETELGLRRMALSMGIGDADQIAGGELLNAISNRMALLMRNPDSGMGMPGAVSDRDLTFLKEAQVGIDRSPEGNRQMLEAFRKLSQRKIEVAQLADQYIQQHGKLDIGFNSELRRYAETHPLFPETATRPNAPASEPQVAPDQAPLPGPDGKPVPAWMIMTNPSTWTPEQEAEFEKRFPLEVQ